MSQIRQSFKLTAVIGLIAIYALWSIVLPLLLKNRWTVTKFRIKALSMMSKAGLWVLGVNLKKEGLNIPSETSLIVSNHLSYLDILILAAISPACFVTSIEVRESPILGFLTKIGGCLFVERRSRKCLDQEIEEITLALKNNINVIIFPEATSTNGSEVLRFRQPLYRSAVLANCSTVPICLNYDKLDSKPVTITNRDKIYWYGEMSFFPHLWQLTRFHNIEVRVSILSELKPTPETDSTHLAQITHQLVSTYFQPCLAN